MKAPRYWAQATRELSQRDPVIRAIASHSPGICLRSRGDPFHTLARSIVGQQISVKAADSVWRNLCEALPSVDPATVHGQHVDVLRGCGLSRSKVEYLRELARHFAEGRFNTRRWPRLPDEALIAELTQVRGIGRWTAEMFLIFFMTRPDVFPIADIGLQKAMSRHYNRDRPISLSKLNTIGARWVPWRTVATWYMWRSLDPIPVEY